MIKNHRKIISFSLAFILMNMAISFAAAAVNPPPPDKPTLDGPTENLKTKTNYVYTACTSNPTGNRVYYQFDWGDGSVSSWKGPQDPDMPVTATHQWEKKDTYYVTVTAMDEITEKTSTSDPLEVHVTIKKIISQPASIPEIPESCDLLVDSQQTQ